MAVVTKSLAIRVWEHLGQGQTTTVGSLQIQVRRTGDARELEICLMKTSLLIAEGTLGCLHFPTRRSAEKWIFRLYEEVELAAVEEVLGYLSKEFSVDIEIV